MSRSPRHPGLIRVTVHVSAANEPHLLAQMDALQRTYTETLNTELEWLRDFGLPPDWYARLRVAAAAKAATPHQYLTDLLTAHALHLPPPPAPPPPPLRGDAHRISLHLTGPNAAFLAAEAEVRRLEPSDTINELLRFAATYDLAPHLLAALQADVQRRHTTLRSHVQSRLLGHVATLPEAPYEPPATGRRARK